jgi:hypothetical protein
MVHGDCRSAGCFAMTDALIEEIYALARESFKGGQTKFHLHAFPFRMTEENMKRHKDSKWYGFWKTLKQGYDDFELARVPPSVAVCSRQYLVNADFFGHDAAPDPGANCPAYRKAPVTPFNPFNGQLMAKAQPPQPAAAVATRSTYAAQSPAVASIRDTTGASPAPAANRANTPTAVSSQPAIVAAQPTKVAHAAPLPIPQAVLQADTRPVSLAGAMAVQPQAVQPAATQPVAATLPPAASEPQAPTSPEKNEVTRGIHNVVESGKGDMIAPPPPPSQGQ